MFFHADEQLPWQSRLASFHILHWACALGIDASGGGLDAVNEDTPQEGEPCREDVAVGQGHVDRHFVELAGCEPKVEPYFGTEYWDSPLEETLLLSWESLHTAEKLHVPPPNPFIATDFSILQQVTAVEEFPQPKTGYASFPAVRRLLPSPELLRSHAAGTGFSDFEK